jgi:hypothetical protein
MQRQIQTWVRHTPAADHCEIRVDNYHRLHFRATQEVALNLAAGTPLTIERMSWGYELTIGTGSRNRVLAHDIRADGSDKCLLSFGKRLAAGVYPCLIEGNVMRIYNEAVL